MKMLLGLLLVGFILSGCGSSPGTEAEVSDGYGSGEVKTVVLRDGTRCAVLVGYAKGAISCDWK